MAHQPRLKSLHPLHHFTMKITPCIPSSTHLKLKALLHAYVLQHVRRIVVEALAQMKSTLLDFLVRFEKSRRSAAAAAAAATTYIFREKIRNKKIKLLSRFIRKQFNRASSHVIPMCENSTSTFAEEFDTSHSYYDSTWTSIISTELQECGDEPISGYLQWLEEKNSGDSGTADVEELNEIDRLAEKFIEMCHEKFRLEKQESYRRYQEMMARSI